jgi:serine/threonine protein kinase/tetratricopeptide (TPR) repeat protein
MAAHESDPSLLFGILALRHGLIEKPDLIAAFETWCQERSRPISESLCDNGALSEIDRTMLEGLVRDHISKQAAAIAGRATSMTAQSLSGPVSASGRPSVWREESSLAAVGISADGGPPTDFDLTIGVSAGFGQRPPNDPESKVGQTGSDGGRFRLLRQHARGGLGVVYVAIDSELNREVALKQIQIQHADDPGSRARFLLEAEITSKLEHPGIVPVYGIGTNEQGRPFYAMRFVRGQSLKEAIDSFHQLYSQRRGDRAERILALRQLLSRFIDVCHAISYSHSRGVIHRDLKPANILLGPYGETLVVDWGLAKVVGFDDLMARPTAHDTLNRHSSSQTSDTRIGVAIGTPYYMSPEQAEGRGADVGPSSDIYSLGATLYYLITGTAALGETTADHQTGRRRLRTIVPPRQVNHQSPAPLEAIVTKAMAAEPANRYPSAQALSDDVERWLADEPVSARREPWHERGRRWMRRHRTGVAAVATALIAATVGLAAILVVQTESNSLLRSANLDLALSNRTAQATNRALMAANDREKKRFDLALEAIKTFHGEVSEDLLLKEKQFDGLRTRMLHSATHFYQRLEELLSDESDQRSRSALGQAYHDIGELTATIGSQPEALAALTRGLELRLAIIAEPGASLQAIRNAGESLIAVGHVQEETGDVTGALKSYTRARTLLEPVFVADPSLTTAGAAVSRCLQGIGRAQYHSGQASEALESHERALSLRKQLAGAHSDITQYQSDLAQSYHDIGDIHRAGGRAQEALAAYERARRIRKELNERDPSNTQFQSELAQSHSDIGYVYQETENFTAALASVEAARTILEKLASANPAVTRFEGDLAQNHQSIGSIQDQTGHRDLAIDSFDRARKILQRLAETNPTITVFQGRLALNHSLVGLARHRAGRPAEAAAELRRAVIIMEHISDLQPSAYDLYNLACFRSLLAGIAQDPRSGLTDADSRNLGKQAVSTLRRAFDAGLSDVAFMRRDDDLDPLRPRADFQMLLMDVVFPREPFAR